MFFVRTNARVPASGCADVISHGSSCTLAAACAPCNAMSAAQCPACRRNNGAGRDRRRKAASACDSHWRQNAPPTSSRSQSSRPPNSTLEHDIIVTQTSGTARVICCHCILRSRMLKRATPQQLRTQPDERHDVGRSKVCALGRCAVSPSEQAMACRGQSAQRTRSRGGTHKK